MSGIIQEAAVSFASAGNNFKPINGRIKLPDKKTDTTIFLVSNSYEYDIELIKKIPQPKLDYKNIIIPFNVNTNLGSKSFKYSIPQNEYNKRITFLNSQKMLPQLRIIDPPYPHKIKENVYVSMSDIIKSGNTVLNGMSTSTIKDSIFDIFKGLIKPFMFSSTYVMIIDTMRYRIYNTTENKDMFKHDIINALIAGYFNSSRNTIPKIPVTLIFHHAENDYKFDLSTFDDRDLDKFQDMLDYIGKPLMTNNHIDDDEVMDDEQDTDIDAIAKDVSVDKYGDNETEETDENPKVASSTSSEINATLNMIKANAVARGTDLTTIDDESEKSKQLRQAKQLEIQAKLLKTITVNTGKVGNYKTISDDMKSGNDSPVENEMIDNASKTVSSVTTASNTQTAMNTTSSARELKMRERIGKLKLGNVTFDTLTSVTDIPKPAPIVPLRISTINKGSLSGTSFSKISKAYEENLMDRDIVQTFMNLSKLPDGFEITDVEVTDISTVHSLLNDWKVSLRSKMTGRQNVIHIRVPKVLNGRFYHNGNWFNLGKQDFPIPVLKLGPKRVMLTSNYQKITLERYDTRSLVDIGILVKVLSKFINEQGQNKYIKPGSSVSSNSRFLSTVEYDEYAKVWLTFTNKEANIEICFNRTKCLSLYGFVNCEENEFCCGMINQVPIVINTDTGLTRDDRTITDIIVQSLPADLQREYQKVKPGKRSMYSEMNATVKTPVGVTCCAWEGLSNVLKKANIDYKVIASRDVAPSGYFTIDFQDCKLAIKNTVPNQLLMNGFYMLNTKSYRMGDFEIPIMNPNSVYIDIYNQHYFKQYSQLTTFIAYYNFFIDAITYDVCLHYNIPNDIVGLLIYGSNMLADNNFIIENTASLYRVRSSEVVPAIIHSEIAFAISKYNNSSGSKSRDHMLKFNPNSVLLTLEMLGTTETANALNPMVELHQQETITQRGWHGVNVDRAYTKAKRSYHESMIGKDALSSPNSANVGINRQLVVDPKIESVRGYTSTDGVDKDYNDLQLASYSELLTPGSVSHDNSIRTAIATSQTSHIVSTAFSEPVLISNGVDEIVSAAVSDEFSVVADEDGVVLDIADGYMIVQYKSTKKRAIPIENRYHANPASGFYVNNKLTTTFQKGDKFKKNDILAYHEKFFTKGIDGVVRVNIGPLAKVALVGTYFTYEDSGMMTESFSKKLATSVTMVSSIRLDATANIEKIVKVGDEVEVGDPLIILGLGDTGDKSVDNFLRAFQADSGSSILDSAKRTYNSKHAGKIVDIKMFTVKSMDKLSPSLYELLSNHFKENEKRRRILDKYDKTNSVYKMETLYDRPTAPLKGQQIKGVTTDVMIEFYIEHEDYQSIGDKLVAFAASKQVIGDMVPIGMEPYTDRNPDEEISVFVSPRSILARMIPGLLTTAAGNKVLVELKRAVRKIWENG